MNLDTPEIQSALRDWYRIANMNLIPAGSSFPDFFRVIDRNGKIANILNWYDGWFKHPNENKLAFKVQKSHWAKGRKMRIESNIKEIPSGDYKIIHKATTHSYDYSDFLIVEYVGLEFDTPRKALNWLERQAADQEKRDGITMEQIIAEMKVRG